MENEPLRYCRKCLLREMSEKEVFENVYSYLQSLPEEDKVPDEVYEERLTVCRSCDYLMSGMCRLCGCYVELRAAMRVRKCPDVPARWEAMKKSED